ncbi:MAG: hypothetical protein BWY04_01564 [candidate division CPR1 bacterium ADurb.Bin160]|uniref:Uncharacterized protein n=1 Tax=candidate division CPR1 bacterium ADurb.Bin160 TaxID=1852826 RepID=A0A1V5ZHL0_9BACT|nr:MAG: hypothetical protein BWY04_01564 [candidate division CPR1 bacterium ADurb.Bin160]
MKRQKTTAELINTGYWLVFQTNQPVEIIDQLFKELNPTPEELSTFWEIFNSVGDILF